jgi:hypothetical protein
MQRGAAPWFPVDLLFRFHLLCYIPAHVVQDGILPPVVDRRYSHFHSLGRVTNPPQVANLHHSYSIS